MDFFFPYLRARAGVMALLAVFAAIFALLTGFSGLPLRTTLYALLLCLAAALCVGAVDYARSLRRHRLLLGQRERVSDAPDAPVPDNSPLGRDYQALLAAEREESRRLRSQADRRREELLDYYTLWVHQAKTPIAAMRLLLHATPSEQSTELAQELQKLEQYVDMALQYLRLEGEGTDFLIRRCDVDALVRRTVRKFAPSFIRRHITLELPETGLSVLTDEKWLGFVLGQLFSNALQYTPPGGAISVYAVGEALVVADTGIGIASEDLPRVFERGYTGCNGRTDRKSTGIGLYLCKKVCDGLGHGLSISSRPGAGTRVRLELGCGEAVSE